MLVGVLGINHKSGPFGLRESLARTTARQLSGASSFAEKISLVVLNTCGRTEFYFSSDNLVEAHSMLIHMLEQELDEPFEHALYTYFGAECFSHLAKVAAGLDSTILFETEIQRQVKTAYSSAATQLSLRPEIHFLFQKSLKLSKEMRRQLPSPVKTFPSIIKEVVGYLLGSWKNLRVLFVGNSEINRQVIAKLQQRNEAILTLCTRSPHAVEDRSMDVQPWSQLAMWPNYDVVIAGTNNASYLIKPVKQKICTKVLIDLGVPRNVDPCLAKHPHLTFFHVEQLSALLKQKADEHKIHVKRAEQKIGERVAQYIQMSTKFANSARRRQAFEPSEAGVEVAQLDTSALVNEWS